MGYMRLRLCRCIVQGFSLCAFYLGYYGRDKGLEVCHCTVVGYIEDRRGGGLVDADDALGIAHAYLVLYGAGYCGVDYQLGLHRSAGLTDLLGMGQHTSVNKRTGGCQLAP